VSDMSPELSGSELVAMLGNDTDRIQVDVSGTILSVRTTGCLAAARQAVYGDLAQFIKGWELVNNLDQYSHFDPSSEALWTAGNVSWSACMRGHDIEAASPESLVARAQRERGGALEPSPQEVRWATADVQCRASTGIGTVRARATGITERRSAALFADDLVAFAQLLESASASHH
jgi:hypothetical protein